MGPKGAKRNLATDKSLRRMVALEHHEFLRWSDDSVFEAPEGRFGVRQLAAALDGDYR